MCAEGGGWKAVAEGEEYGAYVLVLAMPAPPVLDLVNGSGVALPSEAQRDLENIVYQPCIGVLAVLGGEGGVPEPGASRSGASTCSLSRTTAGRASRRRRPSQWTPAGSSAASTPTRTTPE